MAGNDLSFSMLIRLMDGWSGPADKIRQSMKRMTTGAREFKAGFGGAIKSGFSTDAIEAGMLRSERRIGAARQRLLGAAAMAVTLAAPVIQAGNFEEKLIDFANLAEIGTERVEKLKGELDALRKLTGQSNIQLLDGLGAYVGKGMGLDEAIASLQATGRAARATKTEMGEMANSGYAVMDNLKIAPDQLRQAFDIMAKSGKLGSFELAAMARKFPEITAGAKSLKMDGVDAVASLSAALQIAMKAAGSEDQAATNLTNFLGKITAPDTVKKFAEFGVNVEKEMKIAAKRGTDPLEHMLEVISKMTGGDAFKMGELFADKQVLDFLRAMIPNLEEYKRIKAEALGASGVVDADFERVMAGFNAEWSELKNSVTSLVGSSSVLLPIFTDIMREMRMGVETVAAWTQANPELTATIVKGAAALLAFGVGTRVIGFGFALMQGGLLRTASLFLRFNAAGRNVSVVARALRGAGWAAGGLFKGLSGAARLLSKPLRWASFIPKLAWRGLISPLRWASILPRLSWRLLIPVLRWGLRFIPIIGWAALAGELLWSLLIKPMGWDKYIPELSWDGFIGLFTWDNALTVLDWASWLLPVRWLDFIPGFEWKSVLNPFSWNSVMTGIRWASWLTPIPWLEMIPGFEWSSVIKTLGWDGIITTVQWSKWFNFQWKDLLPAWNWGDIIPDFGLAEKLGFGDSPAEPGKVPGLATVTNTDVANMASRGTKGGENQTEIEAYLRGIDASLAPITTAMREGRRAPETSIRPQGRPDAQAYTASQPNVMVESKFESNPKVDVKIDVSMPISITREQKVDNRAIAAAAGRQAGAATERAVRRGLDDAANME